MASSALTAPGGARPSARSRPPAAPFRAPGARSPAASGPPTCGVAITSARRARCGDGIWSGARPTSRAAPAMLLLVERALERRLVDEIAARGVDEPRRAASCARSAAASIRFSVSALATASGTTKSASAEQRARSTCDQRRLDASCRDRARARACRAPAPSVRQIRADGAIADDADRARPGAAGPCAAARHRAAHGRRRRSASCAAPRIDHGADDPFRHRRHEAGRGARDQHAVAARGRHVDVADVDGDALEGDEVGQRVEQRRLARRLAVGDDDRRSPRPPRSARPSSARGRCGLSVTSRDRAQLRQRALAVVVGAASRASG